MEAIPTQVAESFEAARESADRDADDDLAKRAASNVDPSASSTFVTASRSFAICVRAAPARWR